MRLRPALLFALLLFSGLQNRVDNNLAALVKAKSATAQAQVIVLGHAPGASGVVLIVYPAALVFFRKPDFRSLVGFTVELYNVLGPEFIVRAYVNMQGIGAVLQNVVRVPAHDDAGALVGQLQNHVTLGIPQIVRRGQAVHNAGDPLGGKGIGKHAAAGGVLGMLFYELRREAGFLGNIFNEFTVIERNTQLISHHMSDGPSAGTEFTADRNDFLFHNIASKVLFDIHIIVKLTGNVNPPMRFL